LSKRIIVNDASCLIDLRKAGLLSAALLLPFCFQLALPVVRSELRDFTKAEIDDLLARGLEIIDLDSGQVEQALKLKAGQAKLSIYDCFSLTLAVTQEEAILLTGDRGLRTCAEGMGVEVHGVLWITDRLEAEGIETYETLLKALEMLYADPVVFLPDKEIQARIKRLKALLG
jgi:hypothetical protein